MCQRMLGQMYREQRLPPGSCEVLLFVGHHRCRMMGNHAHVWTKVKHLGSQQTRIVQTAQTVGAAHQTQCSRRTTSAATATHSASTVATKHILDGGCFEQSFQHAAGSAMLEALVGRQRVLRTITTVTKLTDVQCVRLLVLVLEMALQRIVTREGSTAIGTFLWFIDATAGRWRHSELAAVIAADSASASTTVR